MNISIQKAPGVDERTQERIKIKLFKLGLKFDWIKDAKVTFKETKSDPDKNKVVEILLTVPGDQIFARAKDETYQLGIKYAMQLIRRELKKHKELEYTET